MAASNETVQAGRFDRRLTFQVKTKTFDSFGGELETWVDAFTVWGAFEPQKSDLLPTADKRFAETIAMFRIRDISGHVIDATIHRIVVIEDGKASPPVVSIWDIYPPLRRGRFRELHIKARHYK
jgi:phage head-tail adaptor, putative, SPP1 family